jgi:hypothetical protein
MNEAYTSPLERHLFITSRNDMTLSAVVSASA